MDNNIPLGAHLVTPRKWYSHHGVYVGNGRIVSNDIGDTIPGEGGVYLVDFGRIESQWGATYLGWAPPIYSTT